MSDIEAARASVARLCESDPLWTMGKHLADAALKAAGKIIAAAEREAGYASDDIERAKAIASLAGTMLSLGLVTIAAEAEDPVGVLDHVAESMKRTPFGNRDLAFGAFFEPSKV